MGEKEFSPAPNSNASFKSASTIQSRWHLTPSWRKTLVSAAVACLVVFVFNLAITIRTIGLPYGGFYDTDSGRRIMFEGSCDESRYLSLGLHLLINVLRTILLAASNYCMQCRSAPNRDEVDRAHAKQQWLDVGILSFRNLRKISRKRAVLWWQLVLSSVPLHLLYNSVGGGGVLPSGRLLSQILHPDAAILPLNGE
jgi:hypothetical protein